MASSGQHHSVRITQSEIPADLHLQDCIIGMKQQMEPESVDVVVTSPPYNIGVRYRRYNDRISREEYLDWLEEWAKTVKQVLAPAGSLFLNIGSKPTDPWVPFEVVQRLRALFHLQNVIHWIKAISIDPENVGYQDRITSVLSAGHYKPVRGERFINDCHEFIFHFTQHGNVKLNRLGVGVPYQDKSNINRWKRTGRDLRCRGNIWFIPYRTIQNRNHERPHPASFPVKLPEMCIKLHGTDRCRLVLDPFLGIGNTGIASLQLKRPFIGFEIDREYFDTARERLAKLSQQGTLFPK